MHIITPNGTIKTLQVGNATRQVAKVNAVTSLEN